jgi:hypothetical protein
MEDSICLPLVTTICNLPWFLTYFNRAISECDVTRERMWVYSIGVLFDTSLQVLIYLLWIEVAPRRLLSAARP